MSEYMIQLNKYLQLIGCFFRKTGDMYDKTQKKKLCDGNHRCVVDCLCGKAFALLTVLISFLYDFVI